MAHRVSRRAARTAVQLVEPSGRRYAGAVAVFRALLRSRSPWVRLAARGGLMRGLRRGRGCLPLRRLSSGARSAAGSARRERLLRPAVPARPPVEVAGAPGLALRGLGIVYVVAFTSLKAQVLGLYGARGILPIQSHLQEIDRAIGTSADGSRIDERRLWWKRFRLAPSLLWLDASDAGVKRLCNVGQSAGAALALGSEDDWRR